MSTQRPPRPGEIAQFSDDRLRSLYRRACDRLRDAGHWSKAPLASQWAREIGTELTARGQFDTVLAVEAEARAEPASGS